MNNASVEDLLWYRELTDEERQRISRLFNTDKTVGEQLDEAYHRGYRTSRSNVSMVIHSMQNGGKTEHEIIEHLKIVR